LDRLFHRKDGETALRQAARLTIGMGVVLPLLYVCTAMISISVLKALQIVPRSGWSPTTINAVAYCVAMAAGTFLFTLLGEVTVQAIQNANRWQRRLRLSVALLLASLIVIGLGLGFVLIVSISDAPIVIFTGKDSWRLLVASLFAPPMLFYAACESLARRRTQLGWGLGELAKN
jgi:hypothetical protein